MDRRDFLASSGKTILGGIALSHHTVSLIKEAHTGDSTVATSPRSRIVFDEGWRFFRGDAANGEIPHTRDHDWELVDTPHDWSIYGPFREENSSGPEEAYLPGGIGWYRKRFTLPASAKDRHFEIE